jgi:hypothetical protein
MNNIVHIDRNAVYQGMRTICSIMKIGKATLKKKIGDGALVAKKGDNGCVIVTGEDMYEYFRNLPNVTIEEKEEVEA